MSNQPTSRSLRRTGLLIALLSGGLTSAALAQPADRAAAINQAIAVAQATNPGTWFLAAEVEPENGTWVVGVKTAPSDGATLYRTDVNAFTFAVRRVRSDAESNSNASKNASIIASQPVATVTLAQALATASAQAPAGAVINEVEFELENSPPGLFYEVRFLTNGVPSSVRVNTQSGQAGGGGSGDDNGGGGAGGGSGDDTGGGGSNGGSGGGSGGAPVVSALTTLGDAINAVPTLNPTGLIKESKFEIKKGAALYKLEVINADDTLTEYKLNGAGALLETSNQFVSAKDAAEIAFIRANIGSATISLPQAISTVLDNNAGATVLEAKWEPEHGRLVAQIKIRLGNRTATAIVDAQTGFLSGGVTPPPPLTTAIDIGTALNNAFLAAPGSTAFKIELERETSGPVYKVWMIDTAALTAQIVRIDGNSGAVRSIVADALSKSERTKIAARNALLSLVTVSYAQAVTLATPNPNPTNAVMREVEIGIQKGRIGYEVDLIAGKTRTKFFVDGQTGAVARRK